MRLLHAAGLDATAELGELTPTGRFRDRLARALLHRDDRVDARLPGLDLTLSAPTSVSILYGLTGGNAHDADQDGDGGEGSPGKVAVTVRQAHRAAVQASIEYLELTCTSALRGHHRGDDTDTRGRDPRPDRGRVRASQQPLRRPATAHPRRGRRERSA